MSPTARRMLPAAALLLLAAALWLRLPRLGDRPFHGDEAVHAVKLRELWEHGRYAYDPNEYHGPTLYYVALPLIAARGLSYADATEADYRLPVALLGAAMVLLPWLLRDGIGPTAVAGAACLMTVSTPFVFYSRYFIQEMLLAAFTLLLIGCGWRYHVSRRPAWLWGAAAAAGLMIATKETCVLTFVALGLGWVGARAGSRGEAEPHTPGGGSIRLLAGGVFLALGVAYLLLSGFLSHPAGPLGYFETYLPWMRRAGGTELHRHPWYYYLSLLTWQQAKGGAGWTELPVLLLALVGASAGLSRAAAERAGADPRLARCVLVYSVVLTAIYSLIPYKTPWNLLSFYLGWILLAGMGTGLLLSLAPRRAFLPAAVLLLALAAGPLAVQAQRVTFDYRDDQPSPYAYAQPTRGLREIEQRVEELVRFSPQKEETVAQLVFRDDYYWPLPWTLRRLKNVGYWGRGVPDEERAHLRGTPIIISAAALDAPMTARLNATHFMVGFHTLREGVLVQIWVKNELWEPFVMSRSRQQAGN